MKKSMCFFLMMVLALSMVSDRLYAQKGPEPKIQVALLLDTSGSMDGLIDQAKTQLWKVVNELATARYEGQMPTLEIALYEYGNDKLLSSEGYIRKISGLSTDLDLISEKLFSLTTDGGDEYCGWVIRTTTNQLDWSKSDEDLKMIFIAGNEPFTQGSVSYEDACKAAIKKGIMINTIFCGDFNEGISTDWKNGADLADGKYMNIDMNSQIVYVESPYDKEILELNEKLNGTYISYGYGGEELKTRQSAQDANAMSMSEEAAINRVVSKSKAVYSNESWDLVDAYDQDDEVFAKLEADELPAELKGKSKEEIAKYLENKKKEREEIQEKINQLNKKRDSFVAEKRKEMADENTLDAALIKAIKVQAESKKYKFED